MAKLDSQTPARISSLDYNAIRNSVIALLGPGSGSRGYGQAIQSSAVSAGELITKSQWDLLRYDITSIKVHQDGVLPPIITLGTNNVVKYGAVAPNTNYESLASQADANRFNIGAGQSALATKATQSRTGAWNTQSQCTLTVTFASASQARYFFNSGGKIRFTSTQSSGIASQQNNAWREVLTAIGTQSFGAASPTLANFYTLTTSYKTFYQYSASSPYSANYFRLEALCNCTGADNSTGTATTVTFRITWQDNYVDPGAPAPGDAVDGTITLTVDEFKAAGQLTPTGTFSITSPSYSLSAITAS